MAEKTLIEKLRECSDCIDEIQEYVGADYIKGFQRQLSEAVMEVLLDHFKLSELKLEVGTLTIKSDNSVRNTIVCVGDIPLNFITQIEWVIDAGEGRGKLHLTF